MVEYIYILEQFFGASNETDDDLRKLDAEKHMLHKLFKDLGTKELYTGSTMSCLEAFMAIEQFRQTANINKTNSVLLLKLISNLLPVGHKLLSCLKTFLKVCLGIIVCF